MTGRLQSQDVQGKAANHQLAISERSTGRYLE